MGKRKRGSDKGHAVSHSESHKEAEKIQASKNGLTNGLAVNGAVDRRWNSLHIQIVVGTYEKTLHGIIANLRAQDDDDPGIFGSVEFAETFLVGGHTSAIRCLALSPSNGESKSNKIFLASGGADQVINLYQLSSRTPQELASSLPSLSHRRVVTSSENRELGSLQHHAGGINRLHFPTRSKLISTAEDSTIAITRTRDWTMLSTIKAPIPKAHGRPSGDTAPLGGAPSGVNDFAIHPSMKLMITVSKGERCMRLWNLVSGKKAGVLNFEKKILQKMGEGKWSSGEGRRVEWNRVGEQFVVLFEKGCMVYGLGSKVICILAPNSFCRLHQLQFLNGEENEGTAADILAVSTEDGSILFFSTAPGDRSDSGDRINDISERRPFAQISGRSQALLGRIKDFKVIYDPHTKSYVFVTGGSDGGIRVWVVPSADLITHMSGEMAKSTADAVDTASKANAAAPEVPKVGKLLGTFEAGNRITCLDAFKMTEFS